MRRWNSFRKGVKKKGLDGDFVSISLSFPKEQYEYLCEQAQKRKLPLSRIVSYAIDNERDCEAPFYYPCTEPTSEFIKHGYTAESQKIYMFLRRFKSGLSKDMIMLFRRAIGVEGKAEVMLGIRELLATKLVKESKRKPPGQQFDFPDDHTWIRLTDEMWAVLEKEREALEKRKAKLAEEELELQKKEFISAKE